VNLEYQQLGHTSQTTISQWRSMVNAAKIHTKLDMCWKLFWQLFINLISGNKTENTQGGLHSAGIWWLCVFMLLRHYLLNSHLTITSHNFSPFFNVQSPQARSFDPAATAFIS
jgi:hypothetical protein